MSCLLTKEAFGAIEDYGFYSRTESALKCRLLLDEVMQSAQVWGEDTELLEIFTYLGNAIHNNGGSGEGLIQLEYLALSVFAQKFFKMLVLPV